MAVYRLGRCFIRTIATILKGDELYLPYGLDYYRLLRWSQPLWTYLASAYPSAALDPPVDPPAEDGSVEVSHP